MYDASTLMSVDAVVSGTKARIYCIFPDGRRKIMGNIIKFNSEVNNDKTHYPILGYNMKPARKGLGTGKGDMKMHYNTSVFREYALEYKKTGRDAYYDFQIVNEDPNSNIGKQVLLLYGVNFDNMPLAMVDAEAEYLTEDLKFTFNDWDMPTGFGPGGLKDA